jgi:3-polyprenyl-4-hydroxybenzoate decarboxylase
MFAGARRNMTLGFPDHLTKWELSDAYREAYLEEMKLVPHEIVADGPVHENVLTGDAIDVTKFPSPVWHENDGGRYPDPLPASGVREKRRARARH